MSKNKIYIKASNFNGLRCFIFMKLFMNTRKLLILEITFISFLPPLLIFF